MSGPVSARFLRSLCIGVWVASILAAPAADRRLVLIAGAPSHGPLDHEFHAGCLLLQRCLQGVPGLKTEVHRNGWPASNEVLVGADAVFIYADGGSGHPLLKGDRMEFTRNLLAKGMGLGCGHFGVEVPKESAGEAFQSWIGGYYEHAYSVNPMWKPEFSSFPNHPITRGVKPFSVTDEWYFNIRFRPELAGVTPLLVAQPSDKVRGGPYVYPQGPYPHIVAASGRPETLMWSVERPDGGRGFGFTGGHRHLNWGNDDFRKIVLNALLWIAKVEVPPNGVNSSMTEPQLMENLDPKEGRKPRVAIPAPPPLPTPK